MSGEDREESVVDIGREGRALALALAGAPLVKRASLAVESGRRVLAPTPDVAGRAYPLHR